MFDDPLPEACQNGHALAPGQMLVGWLPCACTGAVARKGHRTVTCPQCWEVVSFAPAHTDDAEIV